MLRAFGDVCRLCCVFLMLITLQPKYAGFSQASIVPLRRKRVAAKPKIGKAAASAQVASVQTSALMDHSGVATETPPDASPATNQPVASTTVRDSEVDLAGAGQVSVCVFV